MILFIKLMLNKLIKNIFKSINNSYVFKKISKFLKEKFGYFTFFKIQYPSVFLTFRSIVKLKFNNFLRDNRLIINHLNHVRAANVA